MSCWWGRVLELGSITTRVRPSPFVIQSLTDKTRPFGNGITITIDSWVPNRWLLFHANACLFLEVLHLFGSEHLPFSKSIFQFNVTASQDITPSLLSFLPSGPDATAAPALLLSKLARGPPTSRLPASRTRRRFSLPVCTQQSTGEKWLPADVADLDSFLSRF